MSGKSGGQRRSGRAGCAAVGGIAKLQASLELWIFDHVTGREQLLWSKRDVLLWHYGDDGPLSYTDAQASIGRFAGSVVSFEWRFDSVDAAADDGRGVLIDDWRIEAVVCP